MEGRWTMPSLWGGEDKSSARLLRGRARIVPSAPPLRSCRCEWCAPLPRMLKVAVVDQIHLLGMGIGSYTDNFSVHPKESKVFLKAGSIEARRVTF